MSIPSFRATALLSVLALALSAVPAGGALAQSKDIKLSGMGVRKCSQWLQWKESRNAESRAMVLEWAQGFISGHNVYVRTGSASPVVASVSVLIPLLDAYCQKNPEERILAGVIEITQNLGGAKVNLAPKAPSTLPSNPSPEQKGRLDS